MTDYTNQINSIYMAEFGRPADAAGLAYWNGIANTNGPASLSSWIGGGASTQDQAAEAAIISGAKVTDASGFDPNATGNVFNAATDTWGTPSAMSSATPAATSTAATTPPAASTPAAAATNPFTAAFGPGAVLMRDQSGKFFVSADSQGQSNWLYDPATKTFSDAQISTDGKKITAAQLGLGDIAGADVPAALAGVATKAGQNADKWSAAIVNTPANATATPAQLAGIINNGLPGITSYDNKGSSIGGVLGTIALAAAAVTLGPEVLAALGGDAAVGASLGAEAAGGYGAGTGMLDATAALNSAAAGTGIVDAVTNPVTVDPVTGEPIGPSPTPTPSPTTTPGVDPTTGEPIGPSPTPPTVPSAVPPVTNPATVDPVTGEPITTTPGTQLPAPVTTSTPVPVPGGSSISDALKSALAAAGITLSADQLAALAASAVSGGGSLLSSLTGFLTSSAGIAATAAGSIAAAALSKAAGSLQAQGAVQAAGVLSNAATKAAGVQSAAALASGQTLATGAQTAAGQQVGMDQAALGAAKGTLDSQAAIQAPYIGAGTQALTTLNEGLKQGGQFNRAFTMADAQNMPAYNFALQQGNLAITNSAAAKGGLLSTNALQDQVKFAEGTAAQYEQQAFNQWLAQNNLSLGALQQMVSTGQTSTAQLQQALSQYGVSAETINQNIGGAQATGTLGAANATAAGQAGSAMYTAAGITGAAGAQAQGISGAANANAAGNVGAANAALSGASSIGNQLATTAAANTTANQTAANTAALTAAFKPATLSTATTAAIPATNQYSMSQTDLSNLAAG